MQILRPLRLRGSGQVCVQYGLHSGVVAPGQCEQGITRHDGVDGSSGTGGDQEHRYTDLQPCRLWGSGPGLRQYGLHGGVVSAGPVRAGVSPATMVWMVPPGTDRD